MQPERSQLVAPVVRLDGSAGHRQQAQVGEDAQVTSAAERDVMRDNVNSCSEDSSNKTHFQQIHRMNTDCRGLPHPGHVVIPGEIDFFDVNGSVSLPRIKTDVGGEQANVGVFQLAADERELSQSRHPTDPLQERLANTRRFEGHI